MRRPMAYRIFIDSDGVEWQAWDVVPDDVERRLGERRESVEGIAGRERRAGTERRVTEGRWTVLSSGLVEGWLCFEATTVRKRLMPIPSDWSVCADEELELYCRSAKAVRGCASPVFHMTQPETGLGGAP